MVLMIEPNFDFKKIKLISCDKNYSKFNILTTLCLKLAKSPLNFIFTKSFLIIPKACLKFSNIFTFNFIEFSMKKYSIFNNSSIQSLNDVNHLDAPEFIHPKFSNNTKNIVRCIVVWEILNVMNKTNKQNIQNKETSFM